MITTLNTFEETLENIEAAPNLLLGNGFSIGAKREFAYDSLYEVAKEAKLSNGVLEMFEDLRTSNFEEVMDNFEGYKWRLAEHGSSNSDIDDAIAEIKGALIYAIVSVHPNNHLFIDITTKVRIGEWLKRFGAVFTTNYDLLLYWCILEFMRMAGRGMEQFVDGFGKSNMSNYGELRFRGLALHPSRKPFAFLHGGMHLFSEGDHVIKYSRDATDEELLVKFIRGALDDNRLPLIVAEGNWVEKMDVIRNNIYLSTVFGLFGSIRGPLVTYGWNWGSEDQHLIDSICNNDAITDLVIGVYGGGSEQGSEALILRTMHLAEEANRKRRKMDGVAALQVHWYDSQSVGLWTGNR